MRIITGVALLCAAQLAGAQESPVLLRLSPRVGDTLHTRLEQQTDVSVTTPSNPGVPARSVVTTLTLHSRTIVRTVQQWSTTVLTIVDSAALTSTDARAAAMSADAQRALTGQQLVLQLGSDGTVESARDKRGALVSRQMAEAMAAMPAVFPKRAMTVGQQWTREMPLPSSGMLGARGSGLVRATFRLDSLTNSGSSAFISMRGDILPDSAQQGVELSGGITGTMQLDRARGWMTESLFLITLKSMVVPPVASGLAAMKFITRVTQRLRTMDKR